MKPLVLAILLWPHAHVDYRFDPTVSPSLREVVRTAAVFWTQGPAGVTASEKPWTWWFPLAWSLGLDRSVWIRVDPNQTTLGETTLGAGPRRSMTLNPRRSTPDWIEADVVHEWGHVWGLTHEHQRRDRDQYVVFPPGFLESLSPDRRRDYQLLDDPPLDRPRPYDYGSVMQYSSNIDGNRMRRRDTGGLIAQNRVPSSGDWERLTQLYSGKVP